MSWGMTLKVSGGGTWYKRFLAGIFIMIGLGIMEREAFQAIQILLPNLYKNDMNPSVRQKEGLKGTLSGTMWLESSLSLLLMSSIDPGFERNYHFIGWIGCVGVIQFRDLSSILPEQEKSVK
ncbi:hypothetical protein [Desulforhabdus amnigena]|jgi:hypothetical protein|uniref:hypothetical protein n=1 Tax=Desulforhabdus amnigena TaxID=40218 RepID=UPI0016AB520B|nr:hypothetical protein [Desulforhabdus amnigena]NLJ29746.1 hypothetical protein [Deltaproteobacteria bacterium]